MDLAPAPRMVTGRAWALVALMPLLASLASCGGRADDAPDPGIEGTLVAPRADLHAVLGATATGDLVVVTDDGTVVALDTAASFAPTVIGAFGGQLRQDLEIEISGGAVLVWRDRGHDAWDLDVWSHALGRRAVATGLARPTPYGVTRATLDGQRVVFATGGVFTDGVGSDLVYYGATLSAGAGAAPIEPVQLARLPAGSDNLVEIALTGHRAVMKRYTAVALEHDASRRGWPESQEPWQATWYDEAWQSVRGVGHSGDIVVGDTALRVATNGADGELAIVSVDGSDPIAVDHGCRFAEAFFLPGDEDLVYSCRGAANRFTIATAARTTLGNGMKGAYPLECGDSRCHDWIGGPGPSIVASAGGASLPGPHVEPTETAHGTVYGSLSPDGRFSLAGTDTGATSIVEVGHLDHRIVLDREARGFSWLDGARFVSVTTTETNKRYEDAASIVSWRDPSASGVAGERVVTRNAFSPFARAEEGALYAISKSSDRPQGLYRYPLPAARVTQWHSP